jgi:hypothetical protein
METKDFRGPGEPPTDVVRLKIILLEVIPPVWRRVHVPANLTLRRLHSVLQCVMGWTGTEAHQFRVGETLYGKPSDASGSLKDSRWMTLGDVVAACGATAFRYGLGPDGRWEHEVLIEDLAEGNPNNQRPVCLAGERACPPPDCGGPDEYVDRVAAKTPFLPAAEAFRGARDLKFDPEHFDIEAVNRALAWLR